MITKKQKQNDSRYWIRTKYSQSLLNQLIGVGEPDIQALARICNFLGWLDHQILTNLESSKTIRALTFRDQFFDSNKVYKDFKYAIYVREPSPNTPLIRIDRERYPNGYHNNNNTHTILCEHSVRNRPDPFILAGYRYTNMVAIDSETTLRRLLGRDYAKQITRLQELKIILVDDSYIASSEDSKNGVCKSYGITERGKRLLSEAQKEYLYKLTTDPKLIQKNNRNIKDRGYHKSTYRDPVLQNTKSNIDAIDNLSELIDLVPTIKAHRGKSDEEAQRVARYCLIKIATKDYKELSINPTTGRIYPPTATLSKQLKKELIVNGREFVCAIDIRSCIPTFFGLYCLRLRSDHWKAKNLNIDDAELRHELDRYTAIFTSEAQHPRTYLARALKEDLGHTATDQEIKEMLNKGLNGSGKEECKVFRQWLKKRFPTMYRVWTATDIRTSGSNLSKYYESPIFRNDEVIKKAKRCFLEYVDNHDEALLYGEDYNARKFLKWFKPRARKVVGINVQFTEDWAK